MICFGKLIWCVKWRFRTNLKAIDLQQESSKGGVGPCRNSLRDQNGYNGYLSAIKL